MNAKKTIGIAVILLLVIIAGVSAQSRPTASQLVTRWETIIRSLENLERDSRNVRTLERAIARSNYEQNLQNLQRDIRRLGEDTTLFYANGGEFTPAQKNRMDQVGEQIPYIVVQIHRNIQDLIDNF